MSKTGITRVVTKPGEASPRGGSDWKRLAAMTDEAAAAAALADPDVQPLSAARLAGMRRVSRVQVLRQRLATFHFTTPCAISGRRDVRAVPGHFGQLGGMLGWSSRTRVAMLWCFFDESGEFAKGAHGKRSLARLTIGGCVATYESWEIFSMKWAQILASIGLPMFHMADFESRIPSPYADWTDLERRDRLNMFLATIAEHAKDCFGFTNSVRPGDTVSSIYKRCAEDVIMFLNGLDDDIAIVFAHHPEYGAQKKLTDLIVRHTMAAKVRSCTIARPIDNCPLQAADIVAYETAREQRMETRKRRYPIKRLEELGCRFRFSAGD
jgi:hypothetical protein